MHRHFPIALVLLSMLLLGGCAVDGRVDAAIARGVAYLQTRQGEDGAWRSGVHGVFRDGTALTPHVLATLIKLDADATIERGRAWLASVDRARLAYPTYASADASRVFDGAALDEWLDVLRSRQMIDESSFPSTGGWAYPSGPLGATVEANLSATTYAVLALHEAGTPSDDPAIVLALRFIRRCRNDDGGFLFGATDTVDNKAGAGIAYGSTTADGVRAMIACGVDRDDPQLRQSVAWLIDRFDPGNVPGEFTPARQPLRNANYFYYLDALTDAFARADVPKSRWAPGLVDDLLRRQLPDGRWQNDISAGREDDPLVATALALRALQRCR